MGTGHNQGTVDCRSGLHGDCCVPLMMTVEVCTPRRSCEDRIPLSGATLDQWGNPLVPPWPLGGLALMHDVLKALVLLS